MYQLFKVQVSFSRPYLWWSYYLQVHTICFHSFIPCKCFHSILKLHSWEVWRHLNETIYATDLTEFHRTHSWVVPRFINLQHTKPCEDKILPNCSKSFLRYTENNWKIWLGSISMTLGMDTWINRKIGMFWLETNNGFRARSQTLNFSPVYSSDNHNHRPHALEEDQSVFLTPPAQSKVNHVYRDGHDFIGRTTAPGFETPCSGPEVYANKNTKLSLTKNICYNLQNITKVRANGEGTKDLPSKINDKTSSKTSDETSTKPHDHASAEEIAADSMCSKNTEPIPIDLTHVLSSTIAEIPNSLGKLTKCAVKQELITCTPEICWI